jgi:hypothetical protein
MHHVLDRHCTSTQGKQCASCRPCGTMTYYISISFRVLAALAVNGLPREHDGLRNHRKKSLDDLLDQRFELRRILSSLWRRLTGLELHRHLNQLRDPCEFCKMQACLEFTCKRRWSLRPDEECTTYASTKDIKMTIRVRAILFQFFPLSLSGTRVRT